ncbi:MAG: MbnP family protein, partial [Flavobacteriales bacterium]
YMDDFGNRLRADKFMNYISLVTLVKEDGTEVLLKDFMLLDFFESNSVSAEIPEGKYVALKFGIGVPRDNNKDQDPAQYPSSSPLSVAGSQGMFWTWNTGYIFAKFEGKCDTTGTEGTELLTPIAIHTGDDFSYREYVSQPFNLDLTGHAHTFAVHLNVNQIFSPINGNDVNIALDAITHGSTNPDLTNDFMDNYVAALSLEL